MATVGAMTQEQMRELMQSVRSANQELVRRLDKVDTTLADHTRQLTETPARVSRLEQDRRASRAGSSATNLESRGSERHCAKSSWLRPDHFATRCKACTTFTSLKLLRCRSE